MVVTECLVPDRVEVVDLVDVARRAKHKDARAFRARDREHFLVRIEIFRVSWLHSRARNFIATLLADLAGSFPAAARC